MNNLMSSQTRRARLPTETCRADEGNIYNLLVCYRSNQCNIGDDSIVYLSIYSAKEEKFIRCSTSYMNIYISVLSFCACMILYLLYFSKKFIEELFCASF